ncbi:MAG: hypothetical protein AB8G77_16070 [Rhodothermales bacterium]
MRNPFKHSKSLFSIFVIALLLTTLGFNNTYKEVRMSTLEGTWDIDLRPSPDAPPYIQPMVITSTKQNKVKGTFYGSNIKQGRINNKWGKIVFAFVTEDNSGVYHTSGQLEDGRLTGSTHSLGRDFLMPWRGTLSK